MILAIVFLPLLAALVAGLGGRLIGNFAAKLITTGALLITAALSWPIFLSFVAGSAEAEVVPVFDWIRSGTMQVAWALRVDALTAVMLVVVTTVSSLVHVYRSERRSRLRLQSNEAAARELEGEGKTQATSRPASLGDASC